MPWYKSSNVSNRLPGGISAEPKRQADSIAALSYQLMAVGANFPAVKKEPPILFTNSAAKGSCPELLLIWREHLQQLAAINADGGTVTFEKLSYTAMNAEV
jgi:CRISPR-associated protein Csc3